MLLALPLLAARPADPVKITGDKFVVDDASTARDLHRQRRRHAQELHACGRQRWSSITARAAPTSIKSFTATGGVRIKTPDQDATGDKAVYDPKTQLLRLTGNVMVVNATGTVGSPDLVVDLETNDSTFTGGKGGRVTGVFTPQ